MTVRAPAKPRLDNGQNKQFRLHTKTPVGAKSLLPALACPLEKFSAREDARFGPLRLRGLHAQLVADELKGRNDGLVHVIVLVAAQATGEDHVALLNVPPNSMNSLYIIDCIAAYKAIYTYILIYKYI